MTEEPEEKVTTHNHRNDVLELANGIDAFLNAHHDLSASVAVAALLMVAAKGSVMLVENDEHIVNEFRKTLASARLVKEVNEGQKIIKPEEGVN